MHQNSVHITHRSTGVEIFLNAMILLNIFGVINIWLTGKMPSSHSTIYVEQKNPIPFEEVYT